MQRINYNNQPVPLRDGKVQGPRFVLHIVEGEGDNDPGRIRTLRFDTNGGGQGWLDIKWHETTLPDGTVSRSALKTVTIASPHYENGAFFLPLAYEEDPHPQKRAEGPKRWAEWSAKRERKLATGEFPREWLPQKVLDLQEAGRIKRETLVFSAPSLDPMPDAKPEKKADKK